MSLGLNVCSAILGELVSLFQPHHSCPLKWLEGSSEDGQEQTLLYLQWLGRVGCIDKNLVKITQEKQSILLLQIRKAEYEWSNYLELFCPWKLSPSSWIDVLSFRSLINWTISWSFFLTCLPVILVHQICNRIYIVSSSCSENDCGR